MSTKIYNGYQINKKMSAHSLFNLLNKMNKDFQEVCDNLYYREIAKFTSLCLDSKLALGEDRVSDIILTKYKYKPDKYSDSLFFYIDDLIKRDSNSDSIFESDFDFKCEIKLLPIRDKTLFILYTQHSEYKKILGGYDEEGVEKCSEKYPQISPYPFYNNCDAPEHLSDEEWKSREAEWNRALRNKEKGLIYSLVDMPYSYDNNILIKTMSDMYGYRIQRIAKIKLNEDFDRENHELSSSGSLSDYISAQGEYLKSEKYKNDLECTINEFKKIIPKVYSIEDLRSLEIKGDDDKNE